MTTAAGPQAILSNFAQIIIPQLPVQNFMPAQGEPFEFANYVPLPAIGASATVLQFTVPNGRNGFVRRIANVFVGGGFNEGSGNVVFQIFLDLPQNIVAPNFDNIVASLGATNNPSTIDGLHITEGQTVALVVKNVSVVLAGQLVGGRLGGSFYPVSLEPATMAF